MINGLESIDIQCPYCWETIEILIDCSAGNQNYIEDCEVCCRPINIHVQIDNEGIPFVEASREDDL